MSTPSRPKMMLAKIDLMVNLRISMILGLLLLIIMAIFWLITSNIDTTKRLALYLGACFVTWAFICSLLFHDITALVVKRGLKKNERLFLNQEAIEELSLVLLRHEKPYKMMPVSGMRDYMMNHRNAPISDHYGWLSIKRSSFLKSFIAPDDIRAIETSDSSYDVNEDESARIILALCGNRGSRMLKYLDVHFIIHTALQRSAHEMLDLIKKRSGKFKDL